MSSRKACSQTVTNAAIVLLLFASLVSVAASAASPDYIQGVVTSSRGPEAGVWVIAQASDLSTKYTKIVVTDDRGRYVLPQLLQANYQIWVRGYGLVDSKPLTGKPGATVDLKVEVAPDAKTAAQAYPAAWWLSMINLPDGADRQLKFQETIKGCFDCHQLGNKATREFASYLENEKSSLAAWDRRTTFGPSGPAMGSDFQSFGEDRKLFADWTDSIKMGAAPTKAPPRPKGVERNVVITLWDWGTPIDGRADAASSDTRNPRVNANGIVVGVSEMNDGLNVLDPVRNETQVMKIPTNAPPLVSAFNASPAPSPNFGADMWKRVADPRSVGMDSKDRVWFTLRIRDSQQQPAWCAGPNANKYGQYYPLKQGGKQVGVWDPKTNKWEYIDTCFTVDHNQFSKDNFIYYGTSNSIGWIDMNTWDQTHDAEKSQGWCPAVADTNGSGKIEKGWSEPNEPIDPAKDHRINFGCYSITVNPKDGSLWCSGIGAQDKRLVRLEKGPNPPETCRAEFYEPPTGQPLELIGTGGVESNAEGVVFQGWRVSGHYTEFDRNKCKTTSDPQAKGQSCPEGWTILRNTAEPSFGNSSYKATESYLVYEDTADTLGLGKESTMYSSMNTDSLEVLSSNTKQWVTLRVPYPAGFFARSGTGRVDDPKTGWKGKGFWSTYSTYASWHIEGGKGTLPKAVKFQIRPDPLAK